MEWADAVLDDPVFPEFSADGPTKKVKNESAWGQQCSDWAKRSGFLEGLGLHAPRRESLTKAIGNAILHRANSLYEKLTRQ